MPCPPCQYTVPAVSPGLVAEALERLLPTQRTAILVSTLAWLIERHDGLQMFEGITGRPYTNEEKKQIAFDQSAVESLPCPYHEGEKCLIGGLGPKFTYAQEYDKGPYGWLPTLVARALDIVTFRELCKRHFIADAKIALMTRTTEFPTRGMPTAEDVLSGRAPNKRESLGIDSGAVAIAERDTS